MALGITNEYNSYINIGKETQLLAASELFLTFLAPLNSYNFTKLLNSRQ